MDLALHCVASHEAGADPAGFTWTHLTGDASCFYLGYRIADPDGDGTGSTGLRIMDRRSGDLMDCAAAPAQAPAGAVITALELPGDAGCHSQLHVATRWTDGVGLVRVDRDGAHSAVPLPKVDSEIVEISALATFEGYLLCAAVASRGGEAGAVLQLFASDMSEPLRWRAACEPDFGAGGGGARISAIATLEDGCYACVDHPGRGFQVWRASSTDAAGPWQWEPMLLDGAQRFSLNERVSAHAVFDGALYLGTAPSTAPGDRSRGEDFPGCELVRIWPGNEWDIVVGGPRFSGAGLKVPFASLGPGFGRSGNAALVGLCVVSGKLFAATDQPGQLWVSQDGDKWRACNCNDVTGEEFQKLIAVDEALLIATGSADNTESRLWLSEAM